MDYLAAAKKAIASEQKVYQNREETKRNREEMKRNREETKRNREETKQREWILPETETKEKHNIRLKEAQENISFEVRNPELVRKFEIFADSKRFLVVRNEYGELYVDNGMMILSFKDWAELGDRLVFVE